MGIFKLTVMIGFAVSPVVPAGEWMRLNSGNFELYTTAGERSGRQTLEQFEQIRGFFTQVSKSVATQRLPVTIVGFSGSKEYKPYAINEFAAAYYLGDQQRDYIVMSSLGSESMPVAIHEYMHLLVRHSELKWPIWLNEGFAEVYSTLQPSGGKDPPRVHSNRTGGGIGTEPVDAVSGACVRSPRFARVQREKPGRSLVRAKLAHSPHDAPGERLPGALPAVRGTHLELGVHRRVPEGRLR